MPSFSKGEVVLVRYPFTDLSSAKIRPGVVVGRELRSDILAVPLTSRTTGLSNGEFVLTDWRIAGLNFMSEVKRGIYTLYTSLVLKSVGQLSLNDANQLETSLREWLELP